MEGLNSYTGRGLDLEQALRTTDGDLFITRAGKFAAGTTITVTTAALAALETLVSAAATIATLPVSYFAPQTYAGIKTHTADSARTVALATRRTFGADIAPAARAKPNAVESSRVQELKIFAQDKMATALLFGQKNKTAIIAAAVAVTVMGAYYGGLFDHATSLVQSAPVAAPRTIIAPKVIAPKATETLQRMTESLPTSVKPSLTSMEVADIWHSPSLSRSKKAQILSKYVEPSSLNNLGYGRTDVLKAGLAAAAVVTNVASYLFAVPFGVAAPAPYLGLQTASVALGGAAVTL
ncbi:MAG: hypothetical protein P0S96_03650 [Simkaniaceae bacterium]|nr:hypothetical protein [Candidatus Sacchlamyda saccharinae]